MANLNTIVVGLDAVEKGHRKPDTLNISWSPDDRVAASRKARKFAVEAVLIRAAEEMQQYVLAVSRLERFEALRSSWTGDTSAAEKVRQFSKALFPRDYLTVGTTLMIHWRNRVVHTNSNAKLSSTERDLLIEHEGEIEERYGGLSVERLLAHFAEQRPTLKDVSCLIGMSIRLARNIDSRLEDHFSKQDLDTWLDHYELTPAMKKVHRETKPDRIEASLRALLASKAPFLVELYFDHYPNAAKANVHTATA